MHVHVAQLGHPLFKSWLKALLQTQPNYMYVFVQAIFPLEVKKSWHSTFFPQQGPNTAQWKLKAVQ